MKILWFTNTASGASEYLNLQNISGGWLISLGDMLKSEVELHICFYHHKKTPCFEFNGINYHPIKMNSSLLSRISNKLFTVVKDNNDIEEYLKIINKINPDIIHIHGTENAFGCIVNFTEVPVVFSIQGIISSISEKYFAGIDFCQASYKNFRSIKNIIFRNTFISSYYKFKKQKIIEQKNLQKARFIIGRTKWDERITRVLAPHSYYFHNDEILRNEFYEKEWHYNFNNKRLKLYTTNSNSIFKGFETICLTLQILLKLNIEVEWKVSGIKETDEIVDIVKLMLGSDFPKKGLTLMGSISAETIVSTLIDSNIYIMPSHIENSPNNLCEAMIIGLPFIATCAGGTISLFEDQYEGILIQEGDAYSLAGAILELFRNPNKAKDMAENARKKACKRHDKKRVVFELMEIYKKILNYN